MATYIIGDIHNSLIKFNEILEMVSPSTQDSIYLLGDLFDRGGAEPDPVGVYFKASGLNTNVTWIRGNHDQMLAEYIYLYYGASEKKRKKLRSYRYNSFDLMKERLVEIDMLNLADVIMKMPLQVELEVGSTKYLFAHAMTFDPSDGKQKPEAYMEGVIPLNDYHQNGVNGYVSMVGHMDSSYMCRAEYGEYLDGRSDSIWKNKKNTLYLMDCGCGLPNGRLACMCLETGERFYSSPDGIISGNYRKRMVLRKSSL